MNLALNPVPTNYIQQSTNMEIYRITSYLPPINLGFGQTSTFRPATLRCNLSPVAKEFPGLSTGVQMFILGMGFVGKFFAAELKKKEWVVSGSCTSFEKKKKLEELGYQAYVFDANDPQNEVLEVVKNHTHLVISIPPLKGLGDPIFRHKGLLESVLKGGRLRWLVYLSSTKKIMCWQRLFTGTFILVMPLLFIAGLWICVYGDSGGAWVDEEYPAKPESELARARLSAEEEWLCLGQNLNIATQVYRLGGIYGPGRSAVDTILKQGPLSKGQKARLLKDYTSRVHVADICQALYAGILNPSTGKIYNIVDDDPAPREEVFEFAQKLVEEKFPELGKQYIYTERAESLVSPKPSRAEKRVSNARMKKELGVNLLYPTYRSGLRSIMELMAPRS